VYIGSSTRCVVDFEIIDQPTLRGTVRSSLSEMELRIPDRRNKGFDAFLAVKGVLLVTVSSGIAFSVDEV